jgi:hypothetical protein
MAFGVVTNVAVAAISGLRVKAPTAAVPIT